MDGTRNKISHFFHFCVDIYADIPMCIFTYKIYITFFHNIYTET